MTSKSTQPASQGGKPAKTGEIDDKELDNVSGGMTASAGQPAKKPSGGTIPKPFGESGGA
jgi:bacteriocin-like protein